MFPAQPKVTDAGIRVGPVEIVTGDRHAGLSQRGPGQRRRSGWR